MLTLLVLTLFAAPQQPAQATPTPSEVADGCTSVDRSGPGSPEISKRLVDCGYALSARSDYRGAQPVFEAAATMARRRADPAALAEALAGLGRILNALGDAARAESAVLESLTIAERLDDRSKMADAASEMGKIRNMQARYDEARAYHQRSLDLWSEVGNHRGVAVASNNVGTMYRATGDYLSALGYYERSLKGLRDIGDERRSATVLDNMGWIARRMGDSTRGLDLAREALAIREKFNDQQGISHSLGSLSQVYQARGNYSAALDALVKSLELRRVTGAVHAIAEGLNNIAIVYEAQGNYSQAAAYLRQALELNESKVGSTSLSAEILIHLGDVLLLQGDAAGALQSLKRSLAISAASGHKPQAADAQLPLARVHMKVGELTLAAQALGKYLAFLDGAGDRVGRADALVEMAEVERRRNRLTSALTLATEAVQLADDMELPEVRWRALTVAGRIHLARKRFPDARQALDAAMAEVEDVRSLNPGSEESRTRFLAGRLAPFHERIRLALAESRPADAFHFAERSKGRALLDVIRADDTSITQAMTDEERRSERALRSSLSSVNSEVRQAARALPRNAARIAALKRKQAAARLAYDDFQARLYAAHPDLRVSRAAVPIVTAADAQRLVPGAAAIVEFVTGAQSTTAFVVTAAELRAFQLPVSTDRLGAEVRLFREQLANRDLRATESARRLFDLVLGPMQGLLDNRRDLIIVPDGVLWELPFQALRSADNRYLIETAAVSYAPSVTVLRETMRRGLDDQTARTLLAFGNPAPAPAAGGSDLSLADAAVTASLPDAEREVTALAGLYGASSRLYLGANATEERWKAEAEHHGVIHLAAHGVLDNSSPLYSHILLASPSGGSGEDGLLEAWEVMNVQLKADLVVLSACETARGRVAPGEGVIGLMWAFFVAGSPSTLVSQWQVDSRSSTALMVGFHREWRGAGTNTSKARALQQASIKMLQTAAFAHPFYWAGFVLVGDGR